MSRIDSAGWPGRRAVTAIASFVLPASLLLASSGCGESTSTPAPPPPPDATAKGGDELPILKNSKAAKSKTSDEDTSHSLRSKNRRKN